MLWAVQDRGFLPNTNPIVRLNNQIFSPLEDFVRDLPAHISGGHVQNLIQKLPSIPQSLLEDELKTEAEMERAMLLYCMIGHAYINGECGGKLSPSVVGTNTLPNNIGGPWLWLSTQLNRPPILSYASIVLYNWRLVDETKDIQLDNVTILNRFLGLVDEEWFFKIHIVIEFKARKIISSVSKIMRLIQNFEQDQNTMNQKLSTIHDEMNKMIPALQDVNKTLLQLPQRCDPYIFYNCLRSFLASFADGPGRKDGLIFSGTQKSGCPMKFAGASGAQSSILPLLDIFLGIEHKNETLSKIIADMVAYMPSPHRSFLRSIKPGLLRDFISSQRHSFPKLVVTYDTILEEMVRFRKKHLSYAARYIVRQVKQTSNTKYPHNNTVEKLEATGTGGTPFMKYLTDHLKETKRQQFGFKYSQTARVIGLLKDVHGLLPEWLRGPEARVMDLEPQFEAERKAKVVFFSMVLIVLFLFVLVVLL